MDAFSTAPSPQLTLANERLYQLRAEAQTRRAADPQGVCPEALFCSAFGSSPTTVPPSAVAVGLPAHLGWESAPVTAVLRRHWSLDQMAEENPARPSVTAVEVACCPVGLPAANDADCAIAAVKLYPDIGLAMLRQEQAAPGRLWLMLRFLDREGCGKIRIDIIKRTLSTKTSNLFLCGKRQLRNLLRDGEGVYWARDKEYVWLRSAARVAFALGVARLSSRPVALPTAALLDGIGDFRAHLYAAFHSSRAKETGHGDQLMPIARVTLEQLSGVGRSSQRAYEERVGLNIQANFAVGNISTRENQERVAWARGQALFELKDYAGQHGREGKTYLAWQLPNSYAGQHPQRPKGRQKRINRQLQDLVMKGMPGNEGDEVLRSRPAVAAMGKRYYANGRLAAQGRQRSGEVRYWRRPSVGHGRAAIWHPVEGS